MGSDVQLDNWLKKLDEVVDPAHVEASRKLQLKALNFEEVEKLPVISHWPLSEWPVFTYKEGFYDPEKMLLNELAQVWVGALAKDNRMYTIRANHGVGIIASLLGCRIKLHEDNQMPWVEPLSDTELEDALSKGVPDLTSGLGARVLDTEKFYLDTLSRYDNLAQTVKLFCCDIQGPFDSAHLVMGHRIYTDLFDRPELVHAVLDLVTNTFIAFGRLQREVIGESGALHYHSQHVIRGGVRICDDSPTNLSAEMYREFCTPYNECAMVAFEGGWIHYCGDAKQMMPEVLVLNGLTGINFGNPEKQDAGKVFSITKEMRVPVIGWPLEVPKNVKTGVTLIRFLESLEKARSTV